jgi:hypothetical protein
MGQRQAFGAEMPSMHMGSRGPQGQGEPPEPHLCLLLGIRAVLVNSSAHHPQSYGQTERLNRVLWDLDNTTMWLKAY